MSINYSKAHALNIVNILYSFAKCRTYLTPEVPFWINSIVNSFRSKFLGANSYYCIWIGLAFT